LDTGGYTLYHLRSYGIPELRSLALRLSFGAIAAFDSAGQPLKTDSRRAVLRAVRTEG